MSKLTPNIRGVGTSSRVVDAPYRDVDGGGVERFALDVARQPHIQNDSRVSRMTLRHILISPI
jgi:hypothetical protein